MTLSSGFVPTTHRECWRSSQTSLSDLKPFTGTALMRTGPRQHQPGSELKLSVTKAKSSVHPCSAQCNSEPRKSTVTRSIKPPQTSRMWRLSTALLQEDYQSCWIFAVFSPIGPSPRMLVQLKIKCINRLIVMTLILINSHHLTTLFSLSDPIISLC